MNSITSNSSIVVKLSYPVKFLALPRKIGFLFTNRYVYLMWVGHDKKTMEEIRKGKTDVQIFTECLFYAAMAYCEENRKKSNFTQEGLTRALALTKKETIEQIMEVWRQSESFGATVKTSKKKVIR